MYYCKRCEKACNSDEVEIVEGYEEGDWVEIHTECNEAVSFV